MRHWPFIVSGAVLAAGACREHSRESPPPAESLEIASAAPGALGALAAGTDAAPAPPRAPRRTWHVPGDEEELLPDEGAQDPEEVDGGPGFEDGDAGAPRAPTEVPL